MVFSISAGLNQNFAGLDRKNGDEADAELSDLGKVVFLGAAEESGESIVDDLLVHTLSVVMNAQKDLLSLGVSGDRDLDLSGACVEAVLDEFPEKGKRLGELSYQLFEGIV